MTNEQLTAAQNMVSKLRNITLALGNDNRSSFLTDAANMLDAFIEEAVKPVPSPRIYTRCPACLRDTLTINDDKHLLCTWHECPNPTMIDHPVSSPAPVLGLTIKDALEQLRAMTPEGESAVSIRMECCLADTPSRFTVDFAAYAHLPQQNLVSVHYRKSLAGVLTEMQLKLQPPAPSSPDEINTLVATLPGQE